MYYVALIFFKHAELSIASLAKRSKRAVCSYLGIKKNYFVCKEVCVCVCEFQSDQRLGSIYRKLRTQVS